MFSIENRFTARIRHLPLQFTSTRVVRTLPKLKSRLRLSASMPLYTPLTGVTAPTSVLKAAISAISLRLWTVPKVSTCLVARRPFSTLDRQKSILPDGQHIILPLKKSHLLHSLPVPRLLKAITSPPPSRFLKVHTTRDPRVLTYFAIDTSLDDPLVAPATLLKFVRERSGLANVPIPNLLPSLA